MLAFAAVPYHAWNNTVGVSSLPPSLIACCAECLYDLYGVVIHGGGAGGGHYHAFVRDVYREGCWTAPAAGLACCAVLPLTACWLPLTACWLPLTACWLPLTACWLALALLEMPWHNFCLPLSELPSRGVVALSATNVHRVYPSLQPHRCRRARPRGSTVTASRLVQTLVCHCCRSYNARAKSTSAASPPYASRPAGAVHVWLRPCTAR